MTKIKSLTFLVLILTLQSCLDMLDESPKVFVNKFYLKKSTDGVYLMYGKDYNENGTYSFIVKEPILDAFGNDSIIYIKSDFEGTHSYYRINHKNGESVLNMNTIDSLNYSKSIFNQSFKYSFETKKSK